MILFDRNYIYILRRGGNMKELWNKYFNIGTIHFMSFPEVMKGEGPIIETLEKILTNDFFSAVEITRIKDDKVREQAKKMLESSYMVSAYGAQPVLLSNKIFRCKRGCGTVGATSWK
jgi:hypothetical protein